MNPEQAKELGRILRERREEMALSKRQLAERTQMNNATIVRLEQGQIGVPDPAKLSRLADALGLSFADLYAQVGYAVPRELPSFQPYLRSKYRDLPAEAIDDLSDAFSRIVRKHGHDPDGPRDGEDEAP